MASVFGRILQVGNFILISIMWFVLKHTIFEKKNKHEGPPLNLTGWLGCKQKTYKWECTNSYKLAAN